MKNNKSPAKFIKNKKITWHKSGLFLYFISIFILFGIGYVAYAKVSNPEVYQKDEGDDLLSSEWNNLIYDFVDGLGDTMKGDYTVEGKLGIGQVAESQLVVVDDKNDYYAGLYVWGKGTNPKIGLGDRVNHWFIEANELSDGSLKFFRKDYNGEGYNLILTSNGRVGLGTPNPLYNWDIVNNGPTYGRLYSKTGESAGLKLQSNNNMWDVVIPLNSEDLYFNYNGVGDGGNKVVFKGDGKVGIGTTNVGNCQLRVEGDICASGAITSSSGTIGGGNVSAGNLDMNDNILTNIGDSDTDFRTDGGLNLGGDLDMQNNLILNIGNAGTDFTPSGGLDLAGALTVNNILNATGQVNLGVTGSQTLVRGNLQVDEGLILGGSSLTTNGTIRYTAAGGFQGYSAGSWNSLGGTGTTTTFIALTDTPTSTLEGRILRGNTGGTAIEWVSNIYIDANGNIGIGTTTPGSALVIGDNFSVDSNGNMVANSFALASTTTSTLATSSVSEINLNIAGTPTNGQVLIASSTATGGFVWATSTATAIASSSVSEENLNIAGGAPINGQVLIASSTAVGGFVWATSTLDAANLSANNLADGRVLTASSTAPGGFVWAPPGSGADQWGTQVVQTDNTLTGNGTAASVLGLADLPQGTILVGDASNRPATSSAIFIDANGNVGIGTTTPDYALDVEGITRTGGGLIIEARTGSDPPNPVEGQIWVRTDQANNIPSLLVAIESGGTGTSTLPGDGEILMGNASSTYELVSTTTARTRLGLGALAVLDAVSSSTINAGGWQNNFLLVASSTAASGVAWASLDAAGIPDTFFELTDTPTSSTQGQIFKANSSNNLEAASNLFIGPNDNQGNLVQNAITPLHAGSIDNTTGADLAGARSVHVVGKYAYIASEGDNAFVVIDISDPANPTNIGSVVSTAALNEASSVYVAGKYAYVTSDDSNTLTIIDISTSTNPTIVSSVIDDASTALASPNSLYVSGKYVYITSNSENGLEIIDVSNPAEPTHVASTTGLAGPTAIYVAGDYAYITSETSDALNVIKISDPENPILAGSISSTALNGANSVYISGKYAYVTAGSNNSLAVIDISNPASPGPINSTPTTIDGPSSVYVSGKYAYVTSIDDDRLTVIDISSSTNPTIIGSIANGTGGALLNDPNSVYVSGKYAYVAAGASDALEIIDISGIDAPSATIGDIAAGTIDIWENLSVANDAYIRNGLVVGSGGIKVDGDLSISGMTNTDGGLIIEARTNDPPDPVEGQIWLRTDQANNIPTLLVSAANGGTGTTTLPNFGDMLMGNNNDGYDVVPTTTVRERLGLSLGSNIQPFSPSLSTIASLSTTTNNFMIASSTAGWISRPPSFARTSLGLGALAVEDSVSAAQINATNTASANDILSWNGTEFTWTSTSSWNTNTDASITCNGDNTYLDGDGNCDILTNQYLALAATTSLPNLTTVGTITSGVWNGTDIDIENTNLAATPPLRLTGETLSLTTSCTANQVLKWDATTWSCETDSLTNLSDTNIASNSNNDLLRFDGNNWVPLNAGGNNSVLSLNGSGALVWSATSSWSNNLSNLSFASATGVLTASMTNGSTATTSLDNRYLISSNNLSDIVNATTSRTNLGLGDLATLNIEPTSTASANDVLYWNGSNFVWTSTSSWSINRFVDLIDTPSSIGQGQIFTGNASNELIAAPDIFIDSNGNIGLGTTTPSSKLDVVGSINVAGNVLPRGDNRNLGSATRPWNEAYINELFLAPSTINFMNSSNNLIAAIKMDSSGNLFWDDDTTQKTIFRPDRSDTFDALMNYDLRTISRGAIMNPTSTAFSVGQEVIRIDANGNVGIGTSSDNYNFDVDGTIHAQDGFSAGNSIRIGSDDTITATQGATTLGTIAYTATQLSITGGTTGNLLPVVVNGSNFSVTQAGNLTMAGTLTNTGAVNFNSTLNVDGAVTLNNNLDVDGVTTLDRTTIDTSDGNFVVTGSNEVDIDTAADISGRLTLSRTENSDDLTTGSLVIPNGGAAIGRNLNVGEIANIAGNVNIGGGYTGTGANRGLTLTSDGNLQLDGNIVQRSGALYQSDAIRFTGDYRVGLTMQIGVGADGTNTDYLSINTAGTISDNGGNVIINDALDVSGNTTINGNLTISNGSQGNNRILVSDTNGLSRWEDPADLIVGPVEFATNPDNCPAGQYPLGINQTGAVESCTADNTLNVNGTYSGMTVGRATRLASNGSDCATGQYAIGIDDQGNATCQTLPTSVNDEVEDADATYPNMTAGRATRLASNGSDCATGQYAIGIDDQGNAQCLTLPSSSGGGSGGTVTSDGTYPSMTVGKANALSANGSNCNPDQYSLGIDASGNAENCRDLNDAVGNLTGTYNAITVGRALIANELAADGTNCGDGQYAQGIDEEGNATGCTTDNVNDSVSNPSATYADMTVGRANRLTSDGTDCPEGYYPRGVDELGNAELCESVITGSGTITADRLKGPLELCPVGQYARGIDLTGNATGCTSASAGSSDIRLKKDIEDIKDGINIISDLRAVNFNWKNRINESKTPGFIAQEVEQVIPELVSIDNDGYKTLEMNGFIPYLVDAIRELNLKITELEEKIDQQ